MGVNDDGRLSSPRRMKGAPPPDVRELSRVEDRVSFAYFERCVVSQEDNAIAVSNENGTIRIPTASLCVLMLGPGASVSHRAMVSMGECGVAVVWVGERGVRMYGSCRPLTHSSRLLIRQAQLVSNRRTRLQVAREMYQMRFPREDVSKMTMQQLRGREGARIRSVYRSFSKKTGVAWDGRVYDHNDYDAGNDVNKALSAAHACLYGLSHAVISAIGCSPGLGFVHTGHERSFVYDIADLYKAETSIPVAFKAASTAVDDIGAIVRREMRDVFYDGSLIERMVGDIKHLLNDDLTEMPSLDDLALWDEKEGEVECGKSYGMMEGDE